jgi:hypothetical protein
MADGPVNQQHVLRAALLSNVDSAVARYGESLTDSEIADLRSLSRESIENLKQFLVKFPDAGLLADRQQQQQQQQQQQRRATV